MNKAEFERLCANPIDDQEWLIITSSLIDSLSPQAIGAATSITVLAIRIARKAMQLEKDLTRLQAVTRNVDETHLTPDAFFNALNYGRALRKRNAVLEDLAESNRATIQRQSDEIQRLHTELTAYNEIIMAYRAISTESRPSDGQ